MNEYIIAASILSANLARLGEDVTHVLNAGADWVHFDVMDNHYVPNLTFGPVVCQALRDYGITVPIDVHLMVKPVDQLIEQFAIAGASTLTIHPQATEHLDRSLQLIKDLGVKAGLALNPATPLSYLDDILTKLDMVLLMSVNPGFAGQKFIENTLSRIERTRALIDSVNPNIRLEVDGGIGIHNIADIAAKGADTFVAGSAIFNSDDYQATIQSFHNSLKTR